MKELTFRWNGLIWLETKANFQQHGKNVLIQQIYEGKGNQRESSNYTGISPLPIFRKINLAIRTLRVREWLLHHKNWPCLGQDLLKKKRTVDNMFQLNHVLINTWDKKVAYYMAVLHILKQNVTPLMQKVCGLKWEINGWEQNEL
jgi:hypothetical protein